LLGRDGRRKHAERLAERKPGGKVRPWKEYVAWGKELFLTCQVTQPPEGPAPSKPISEHYKCTHCHNNRREDRSLTVQDPEDRVAYIEASKPGDAPFLLQTGTTMWGAVNRESFYNDSYAPYHTLPVAGGKPMNPRSLEDSTQVCCTYCSVGRLATDWEIDALLAYFWELEVRLTDLELPEGVERSLAATLAATGADRDPKAVNQARAMLQRLYLRAAGDAYTAPPKQLEAKSAGPYPDKAKYQGEPKVGEKLYKLACDQCHGEGKPHESAGADLLRDVRRYHLILSSGTHQDKEPYMPMFTSQRLSRQQIADIEAYLRTL
ncbi:MAG TPA: cytochrome c, partial [Planctomycetia bacterium]|nr:cytochrome c [Planctomycetia bacterium]